MQNYNSPNVLFLNLLIPESSIYILRKRANEIENIVLHSIVLYIVGLLISTLCLSIFDSVVLRIHTKSTGCF